MCACQCVTPAATPTEKTAPAAVGRPSKFKPEYVDQARKLAQLGATDREVAEFFNVSEQTPNTWKHVHPEFLESLKLRAFSVTT